MGDVCYSDSECASYKMAAKFLGDNVEDWGGGTGWARRYFKEYRNVDFSGHKNVDEIIDLTEYTSSVDNILIRQVLDAEERWEKIIENAKKSFKKKLCIIVGTPRVKKTRLGTVEPVFLADGSKVIGEYYQEMCYNPEDIKAFFPEGEYRITEEEVETNQYYHKDWILYVEKIV